MLSVFIFIFVWLYKKVLGDTSTEEALSKFKLLLLFRDIVGGKNWIQKPQGAVFFWKANISRRHCQRHAFFSPFLVKCRIADICCCSRYLSRSQMCFVIAITKLMIVDITSWSVSSDSLMSLFSEQKSRNKKDSSSTWKTSRILLHMLQYVV